MQVKVGRWQEDMEGEERHLSMRRDERYERSNDGMRLGSIVGPGVDWTRPEKTPSAAAASNGDRHMNSCTRTSDRGYRCPPRSPVGNVYAHFRRSIRYCPAENGPGTNGSSHSHTAHGPSQADSQQQGDIRSSAGQERGCTLAETPSDSTHSRHRMEVLRSPANWLAQGVAVSRDPVAYMYRPVQEPEGLSAVMEAEVAVMDN